MRKITMLLATVGAMLLLVSGVALAATINGTSGHDTLRGGEGTDIIHGRGGSDTIHGGYGEDRLYGDTGNDTLRGGYGGDRLYGDTGNDTLRGGHAQDRIFGGQGRDIVDGEQGNDYINVADGTVDSVSCGVGANDTAVVDNADLRSNSFEDFVRLSSCENTMVR
jgi:Ca2+-binding RTX toxin-like protein